MRLFALSALSVSLLSPVAGVFAAPSAKRPAKPAARPAAALPPLWKQADIGAVGVPGTARARSGTFIVTGAGEDIFGTADSFHFVWRPWHGDGQITVRVVHYTRQDMWTKVGVMARETTVAGAKFADVLVTPDRGAEFQWRSETNGETQTTDQVPSPAPFWVRLVRSGNTLTGSVSRDGRTWEPRGQTTLPLAADILLGICVTSHKNTVTTEAAVDSVTIK